MLEKIILEFASGRTQEFPATVVSFSDKEYTGNFCCEEKDGFLEVSAVLSPMGVPADPISRITTVSMALPWVADDRVLLWALYLWRASGR